MRLKINFLLLFLFLTANNLFSQINNYNYSREIKGVSETWHAIDLPDAIFGKVLPTLNDIRIYGLTENDTIEIPYILKIASEKQSEEKVAFNLINSSEKMGMYFFTFEIPSEKTINEIQMNFKQENFDWLANVEGSNDNTEWFSIITDYRILSIKNDQTDYRFTTVKFPKSKYHYIRLSIKSDKKPDLVAAKTQINTSELPDFKIYKVKKFSVTEDKQLKKTILTIDFSQPIPLSFLSFKITDSIDYYRPISIKYLADSIKTEKGWKPNFVGLERSVLSSLENNGVYFESTIAKKLRVEIENFDNRPLNIEGVIAKGYTHKLVARFGENANYYLVYGKKTANKANYDISKFTANIPGNISEVKLSDEKVIDKKEESKTSPLFENKLWLWIVMGLIICTLGWFTIKMMQKK